MKKRILSILLAVALLLSVGVVPARAADSCVSVKADAATTAEVVAGDLLEIPLGDIFRDSDGHSLTYTLVNAAQFGTQTKVGGSTLYVSEKGPGTYEPKIKATCSGGKSVTATLTVTVKPAPHGLDAQYNYDESPAKEVTVYVTISNDGVPIRGRDGTILCHQAITVPYFDLSQYGLDEFYRYHTANGEGMYVDNNIVERPTCTSICWSATSSGFPKASAAREDTTASVWRASGWTTMFTTWTKTLPTRLRWPR